MQLNEDGLTLFVPLQFNHRYVDAVLRYVPPPEETQKRTGTKGKSFSPPKKKQKMTAHAENFPLHRKVEIFGVQITLQSFQRHKNSLKFFSSLGDHKAYVKDNEEVLERFMIWLSTPQSDVDTTLPSAAGDSYVAFRQTTS